MSLPLPPLSPRSLNFFRPLLAEGWRLEREREGESGKGGDVGAASVVSSITARLFSAYVTLHEWSEAVHSVLPPSVEGSTEGENDVVQPPRFFPEVDPDTFVTE